MIKKISVALAFAFLICLGGCSSVTNEEAGSKTQTITQSDSDYIVNTDWMTLYFSKKDFNETEIAKITEEAVGIMEDVRQYLNVDYTLEEAKETVCYFDSSLRYSNGTERSWCLWEERKMFCVSLDDFVHEYVHMVCENNAEIVYHPELFFSEGLAQYVELKFYKDIASRDYVYFKEKPVSEVPIPSEHQMICDLLSENELAYTAENYNKAFVALFDSIYDVPQLNKKGDFYKYYVGQVFVDYCINRLGGLETFMSVYCDSVTAIDLYGKSIEEIVIEACEHNTAQFYKQ